MFKHLFASLLLLLAGTPTISAALPVRSLAQRAGAAALFGLLAKEHLGVLAARKELAIVIARGNTQEQEHLQALSAKNLENVAVDLLFDNQMRKIYRIAPATLLDARKEKETLLVERAKEPAGSPLYQELTFKIAVAAAMTHLEDRKTARIMKTLPLIGYLCGLSLSKQTSRTPPLSKTWIARMLPHLPLLLPHCARDTRMLQGKSPKE